MVTKKHPQPGRVRSGYLSVFPTTTIIIEIAEFYTELSGLSKSARSRVQFSLGADLQNTEVRAL